MGCKNCIDVCCKDPKRKPELVVAKHCVVPPGVYENVTVEINERCEVVRLITAEKVIVKGCDQCR